MMDAKITQNTDQPLLSRKRVQMHITYEGSTPRKLLIRKKVAELAKAKEDLVALRSISTHTGTRDAEVLAHVYADAEVMKSVEESYIPKRIAKQIEAEEKAAAEAAKKAEEAKAAEEAAKAEAAEDAAAEGDAPAADAPAEEKKEEGA